MRRKFFHAGYIRKLFQRFDCFSNPLCFFPVDPAQVFFDAFGVFYFKHGSAVGPYIVVRYNFTFFDFRSSCFYFFTKILVLIPV